MNIIELKAYIDQLSEESIDEWVRANPPEKIKADFKEQLTKARNKILFTALGFQVEGSKVFIPHRWNGDEPRPFVAEYVKDIAETTVKEFVQRHVDKVAPALENKAIQNFASDYAREFYNELHSEVRKVAREHANRAKGQVATLIDSVMDQGPPGEE